MLEEWIKLALLWIGRGEEETEVGKEPYDYQNPKPISTNPFRTPRTYIDKEN